jgi:hypothetical protein
MHGCEAHPIKVRFIGFIGISNLSAEGLLEIVERGFFFEAMLIMCSE